MRGGVEKGNELFDHYLSFFNNFSMNRGVHVTCIWRIQQSSARWPHFLLGCVCHQAFYIQLLWESCSRKMCLCTLMHTWHAYTHNHWLTQIQRGINVRNRLQGLNLAFCGCGLTPHAVCVTVSHGKNYMLWARGWCCSSRMCFQWWGLAVHVDMLRQILSTFLPSSSSSQWPPTHTVSPELLAFSV